MAGRRRRRIALKLLLSLSVRYDNCGCGHFLPSLPSYDTEEEEGDHQSDTQFGELSILSYHNSHALLFGWCLTLIIIRSKANWWLSRE